MARGRRKGAPIHGWLAIDKDEGDSSTQVVNIVKRWTNAQKAGHGGTLDPLATGLLPIALGEATKTVSYVMDAAKTYRFTVKFGEATDTDDSEGEVIATSDRRPDDAAIEAALPAFRGPILQRPPSYAAVKVNGERAYDLARRGEAVELEPRPVRIDALDLIERPSPDAAVFEMRCGKGSYVRALARDLGEALGTRAHVVRLRRTAVGPFRVEDATPLSALKLICQEDSLPQVLVPVATALAGIPAFALTEPQADRLAAGRSIRIAPKTISGEIEDGAAVRAMHGRRVIALARLEGAELSPVRVFNH